MPTDEFDHRTLSSVGAKKKENDGFYSNDSGRRRKGGSVDGRMPSASLVGSGPLSGPLPGRGLWKGSEGKGNGK